MLTYITILTEKCFFVIRAGYDCEAILSKQKSQVQVRVIRPNQINNLVQEEQYTECIQNTQKYESSEVYILSYRKKIK